MNKKDAIKAIGLFKAWMPNVVIAKAFKISPQLLGYILRRELGAEYKKIRQAKIDYHNNNSQRYYHINKAYRLKTLKRANDKYNKIT